MVYGVRMLGAGEIIQGLVATPDMGASAAAADPVLWRFLGRLHPLVVHFPLALILLAAALEVLLVFRKGHRTSRTAVTCLVVGTAMAGIAAWFGWLNAAHEPRGQSIAVTLVPPENSVLPIVHRLALAR